MTFKLISTFFRTPVSKVLDKVLCFILGRDFCHEFFLYFLKFFHNYFPNIIYQGKINNL